MLIRNVLNIYNAHVHFAKCGGFTFLKYTWLSNCVLCVWCFIRQKACKLIILNILYASHLMKVILIKYLNFAVNFVLIFNMSMHIKMISWF